MKKQENWGRRAAVWMAAWSLLVTGCGASESPAQADGTGGEQTEGFLAMADAFVQEKIQAASL